MIIGNFIKCLRCPITGENLVIIKKSELDEINNAIRSHKYLDINNQPVKYQLKSGLASQNRKVFYPIYGEILDLTISAAIISDRKLGKGSETDYRSIGVKRFYDQVGWKKRSGIYDDANKFEDLRLVSFNYRHKCHLRVNRYLKNCGKYFLDAGSGPIQYREYLTYSRNYSKRICVDISLLALKEAKKKLKSNGIYILADLINLPFKDNVFDGVISAHVIYHIPPPGQIKAFTEIYRTLKPGAKAAVIYSWPEKYNLINFIGGIFRKLRIIKSSNVTGEFLFHPLTYNYIKTKLPFNLNIYPWRSVSVNFMKKYIHPQTFGEPLLSFIYFLEEKFPKFFGIYGRYPLIVILKP